MLRAGGKKMTNRKVFRLVTMNKSEKVSVLAFFKTKSDQEAAFLAATREMIVETNKVRTQAIPLLNWSNRKRVASNMTCTKTSAIPNALL